MPSGEIARGLPRLDALNVEAEPVARLAAGEDDALAVGKPGRGLLGADVAGRELVVIARSRWAEG